MDMLPAPKSAMPTKIKLNKANTTNKVQDKQPMIPYTLTKKKNVKRNDNMPDSINPQENEDNIDAGGFFGNLDNNNISSTSNVPRLISFYLIIIYPCMKCEIVNTRNHKYE